MVMDQLQKIQLKNALKEKQKIVVGIIHQLQKNKFNVKNVKKVIILKKINVNKVSFQIVNMQLENLHVVHVKKVIGLLVKEMKMMIQLLLNTV